MSTISSPLSLLLLLLHLHHSFGDNIGINYGQIADNLPSPPQVSSLLQSLSITKVKLYDADPAVLTAFAFANTNISFTVGLADADVATVAASPANALAWLQQHVVPYLPQTLITCITVGNEVFSTNDTSLISNLLPAMQYLHQGLVTLHLDSHVSVSTAHSLAVLAGSYPPSAATFRQDLVEYIQPILDFHSQVNSSFLVNAYPYFAYMANPNSLSLQYVLFEPNSNVTDPNTGLSYDNMLYAQIDAVYAAMKALGYTDVAVTVSETGWPSKGDADEAGATPQNAALYNGNLIRRMMMNQGTPMNPSVPIDVYVFALFNEDLKPGPTSERNYGLFYPNGTQVYDVGLQPGGVYPQSPSSELLPFLSSSTSKLIKLQVMSCLSFIVPLITALIF